MFKKNLLLIFLFNMQIYSSEVKNYHDLINDNLTTKQTRLRTFLSVL